MVSCKKNHKLPLNTKKLLVSCGFNQSSRSGILIGVRTARFDGL